MVVDRRDAVPLFRGEIYFEPSIVLSGLHLISLRLFSIHLQQQNFPTSRLWLAIIPQMGRYNLDAHRVQRHATSLLRTYGNQHSLPPPWFAAVSQNPPPQILTRPPLRRPQRAGKRPSQLFKPVKLSYEEDKLRWEYFNDHPWELARPRIVLEDDGRDVEKWDWSIELDFASNRPKRGTKDEEDRTPAMWDWIWQRQSARPLNGESVIQRQAWLLRNTPLTPAAAYDKARKELYRVRHAQETERRIAKEEAQATGAFFGKGPLEVGMHLENSAFEDWKAWAIKESMALKQMQSAAYTGNEVEEADAGPSEQNLQEELQVKEIADAVPGSKRGQEVKGGAAIHP